MLIDGDKFCKFISIKQAIEPPGFNTVQKPGNHRKSCMVIYENHKVIESTIEVYGNMKVIKRPIYSMISCKSCYTCTCVVTFPDLIQLGYWGNTQRTPLRDRGRLGNDPQ